MRTIGVVTTARSDFGIYLSVLRRLRAEPGARLVVFAGGTHLSPEFGSTIREVEAEGFAVVHRVEGLLSSDSAEGIAKSMGLGTIGFAQALAADRPDILVVLGDRFEMHAAAVAAVPFNIPVAHIHGGELTIGAIDDVFRHSMTKLAHLHFPTTEIYARRLRQMGEEPWRITVAGAPSLDNLSQVTLASRAELEAHIGMALDPAPLLVTYHPETRQPEAAELQVRACLAALHEVGMPVIFTLPNADTGGRVIIDLLRAAVPKRNHWRMVDNLGTARYFGLMRCVAAMVGNSSSGLIEAPSFGLPVVNIGERQAARVRAENVLDVPSESEAILLAIRRAVDPAFRDRLRGLKNPYGDGRAGERIVSTLMAIELGPRLTTKLFCDLAGSY